MEEKEIPRTMIQMYGEKFVDGRVQQKWNVPDKVAVKAAVVGAFFDREQNPNQPYTPEEI